VRGCLRKAKTKLGLSKGEHSWDIILSLGRGADGKYKQKWVRFHGTRKQAEQKLTELTGEVHRGEFVEPSKLTVGRWLDEWLEKAIRPPLYTEHLQDVLLHCKEVFEAKSWPSAPTAPFSVAR
jgi:hypothetical protein